MKEKYSINWHIMEKYDNDLNMDEWYFIEEYLLMPNNRKRSNYDL